MSGQCRILEVISGKVSVLLLCLLPTARSFSVGLARSNETRKQGTSQRISTDLSERSRSDDVRNIVLMEGARHPVFRLVVLSPQ